MVDEHHRNGRLRTADTLKGILILGVVFVHMFMLNQVDDTERSVPLLLQPLYISLMGFFIISGYFLPSGSTYFENIRKRSKLLIVLIICSITLPIILYLWLCALGQSPSLDDLWLSITSSLDIQNIFRPLDLADPIKVCYSAYVHYFLWVMFWSFLIFYAVAERVTSNRRLFVITILILIAAEAILIWIGIRLPFDATLIPISTSFMLSGAFISKMDFLERLDSKELYSSHTWIPLMISVTLLIVLVYLFPPGVKFNFSYLGEYGGLSAFPFFVEGFLVFVIFAYMSAVLARVPILSDFFVICGRYSLALAVLHIFIVRMVLAVFYTLPTDTVFPPLSTVQILALTFFDITVIVLLCMWVERRRSARIRGKGVSDTEVISNP